MIIDTLSKINCATLSPRASQICFLSFCSLRMPVVGVSRKESFCTHTYVDSARIKSSLICTLLFYPKETWDWTLIMKHIPFMVQFCILGNNACITCQDCLYLCILATRKVGYFPWACFTEYTANSKAFWSISLKPNFRNVAICIWQYCTIIVE